jgi:hypothetical protein
MDAQLRAGRRGAQLFVASPDCPLGCGAEGVDR